LDFYEAITKKLYITEESTEGLSKTGKIAFGLT